MVAAVAALDSTAARPQPGDVHLQRTASLLAGCEKGTHVRDSTLELELGELHLLGASRNLTADSDPADLEGRMARFGRGFEPEAHPVPARTDDVDLEMAVVEAAAGTSRFESPGR